MMNCEQFQALAQALARDEGLDVATLEGALSHADSCESCDALLEEAESLTSDLRALAARHADEAAPACVETALLLAFRQQRQPGASVSNLRWRRWSAGIAGVAAAILLVLALTGRPTALWHPAGVATATQPDQPDRAPVMLATASAPQQASETAAVDDEEGADSFVPLSGTYDLASLNEDPIVRVVLSGEDLESLGLPVGDSGDEQVVADLIIANDGTPQAIRVVSW
jgi:hypothetical protein